VETEGSVPFSPQSAIDLHCKGCKCTFPCFSYNIASLNQHRHFHHSENLKSHGMRYLRSLTSSTIESQILIRYLRSETVVAVVLSVDVLAGCESASSCRSLQTLVRKCRLHIRVEFRCVIYACIFCCVFQEALLSDLKSTTDI
jgi:hypothetical protein